MDLTKIFRILTLVEYIAQAVQLVLNKIKGDKDEEAQ